MALVLLNLWKMGVDYQKIINLLYGNCVSLFVVVLSNLATRKVFELINSLVAPALVSSSQLSIEVQNAAGRTVKIEFASDPDICIREELMSGKFRNLVAIEIKGGKDYSNIHNRIGEAEKSHQKARKEGYVECWTIVGVTDLKLELVKYELLKSTSLKEQPLKSQLSI